MQRARLTDGTLVAFTYDHSGIRQSKTVTRGNRTTTHEFYTQGGRIVAETRTDWTGFRTTFEFIYDEAGRPLQLIFNGNTYTYILNLQGDVMQLRDADGNVVAQYLYNAWGQLISSSGRMAAANPLRYRGKFWCDSIGFYYLNSRFFCSYIGRFLNADGLVSTGLGILGFNMFAYCNNNPVMHIDPSGYIMAGWSQNMTQAQINQQNIEVARWVAQQQAQMRRAAVRRRINASLGGGRVELGDGRYELNPWLELSGPSVRNGLNLVNFSAGLGGEGAGNEHFDLSFRAMTATARAGVIIDPINPAETFVGARASATFASGGAETRMPIPFTNTYIILGGQVDVLSIGKKAYWSNNRFRFGGSVGVGGSVVIGLAPRG